MQIIAKNKYRLPFFIVIGVVVCVIVFGLLGASIYFGSFTKGLAFIFQFGVSDFGQVIYFTLVENPYLTTFHTMYTPLNFLLMLPFALICKGNPVFYTLYDIPHREIYNLAITQTWEFWVSYLLYLGIHFALIGILLKRMRKWGKGEFPLFYCIIIFSNFFAFAISRGTNVFQTLLFALLFLYWRNSDKAWKRELALLALAVAGVMKYYPLLLGVFLLRDKRYFDSLRVGLYSVLLFFLPFLGYEGGLENIVSYLTNLFCFTGGENRLNEGLNLSVMSLCCRFLALFGVGKSVSVVVGGMAIALCFGMSVAVGLWGKDRFGCAVAVCCGMALVPPVSYCYLVMFLVLPLLVWQDEPPKEKPRKVFYLVFFSVMGCLPLMVFFDYTVNAVLFLVALVWEFTLLLRQKIKAKERI